MNRLKTIASTLAVFSLFSASTKAHIDSLHSESITSEFSINQNQIEMNGRTYVRYDDMLFPINKYSTQSQFDLNKSKWTDGKVFYSFALDVLQENRDQFLKATEIWTEIAQVTFIERTDQANYILVQNGSGNFATVGMAGGQQTLTMKTWGSLYILVHELGHSLGMWHEQQRSDRDNFVDIHIENVEDNQTHNFNTRSTSTYNEYDFLSVMHYPSKAWSKNGEATIVPKSGYENFITHMGQRSFLSGGDQYSVASHYGAKIIDIPDAAFKNYLVQNFDLNNDNEIDSLEAVKVKSIRTPGNGEISSIEGIRFFRFLQTLDVSDENLTSIANLPNHLLNIDFSNNNLENVESDWGLPPLLERIQIDGNPIDEYSCNSIQFLESTIEGSFTFNPNKAGHNLTCDESAAYILYNNKTREDLRSKSAQTYYIDVPANIGQLNFSTTNFENEIGGEMDIFVTFNRQPSSGDFEHYSNNSGNVESVSIQSPQEGRWYVLLQPTDRSFESVNLTASYSKTATPKNQLKNGEAISDLEGKKDSSQLFMLDIPENATNLNIDISGGAGDADLYVKMGGEPTTSDYDCRPWKSGNLENCHFPSPQAGRYYVMIQGYSDYQGLQLVASYEVSDNQQGGRETHSNLSASTGQWIDFRIEVPAGMSILTASTNGGSGDADLYVRRLSQPTQSGYDCRPYLTGNSEDCVIQSPQQGVWYISLRAYSSFSDVNLTIEWKP